MKILITEPLDFSNNNFFLLENIAEIKTGPFTRQELLLEVGDVDVLMVRLNHSIDKEIIQHSKKLKYILTATTGLNHIDEKEAKSRKIEIISLRGETNFLSQIPSTAEHTWSLLLSLVRKIPSALNHVKQGKWNRDEFKSHNLNHFTLGILGFGRVGKQIAEYAKVFNMNFMYYDLNAIETSPKFSIDSLEEFLTRIDILSIHIPLNENNRHFLNSSNLIHLKPDVLIINTSRGEVIDEEFIAAALKNNKIGGYATDVLSNEIDPVLRDQNPLLKMVKSFDNLVITPHIAGATYESMWKTEEFVIQKFLNIIN